MPLEDKRSCAAFEAYYADMQPDYLMLGGDFLDFNCISSHNKDRLRAIEGQRIHKDVEYANKKLDLLQRVSPDTQIIFLEGNHDYRLVRYVDANPQLEGLLELPKLLRLRQRGIEWVPSWSKGKVRRVGKANFVHGYRCCDAHAKAMVLAYEGNIFYGHIHDIQSYSKKTKGDDKTRIGQSLGCLCSYDQAYMKGAPNWWIQGFGVFYFRTNGNFNHYVVSILNHAFTAPNGKFYDGKQLIKTHGTN